MPNFATNYVTIVGEPEQIDALVAGAITAGDAEYHAATLDFEAIVPMPPELRDTVCPVRVVDTQAEADELNERLRVQAERNPGIHQGKTIAAITTAEAGRREAAYGRTGLSQPVLTWYEWAIKYWGTKWPVTRAATYSRAQPGRLNLVFTTAWSLPEPIFAALENQYQVKVHARAMIEGGYPDETYGDPGDYIDEVRTLEFY